jgi:hypothetical protein
VIISNACLSFKNYLRLFMICVMILNYDVTVCKHYVIYGINIQYYNKTDINFVISELYLLLKLKIEKVSPSYIGQWVRNCALLRLYHWIQNPRHYDFNPNIWECFYYIWNSEDNKPSMLENCTLWMVYESVICQIWHKRSKSDWLLNSNIVLTKSALS